MDPNKVSHKRPGDSKLTFYTKLC